MWIKKIHIDDFGKFSNYDLELDQGFTVLHGHNEDGKSTLMAFIQMMFYGYSGRSQDISLNPRKKFSPWNGRDMKGYILFEDDGVNYRLERHFGKSNTTDAIKVWNLDNGEEIKMPAKKDPGEVFFDLGSEAFERSVFIGQSGSIIETKGKKDEITEKLLNMVTTGDENTSYQEVNEFLRTHQEGLVSRSKKIGIIDKMKESLKNLEEEKYQAQVDEEDKKAGQLKIDQMKEEKQRLIQMKNEKEQFIELEQIHQHKNVLEKNLKRKNDIQTIEGEIEDLKRSLYRDDVVLDDDYITRMENFRQETNALSQALEGIKENHQKLKDKEENLLKNPPKEIKESDVETLRTHTKTLEDLKEEQKTLDGKIEVLGRYIKEMTQFEKFKKDEEEAKLELEELETKLKKEESIYLNLKQDFDQSNEDKQKLEKDLAELEKEKYQIDISLRAKEVEEKSAKLRHSERITELNEEIRKAKDPSAYEDEVESTKKSVKPVMVIASFVLIILGIILGLMVDPLLYGLSALGLVLLVISFVGAKKPSPGVRKVDPQYIESLELKRDKREEEQKKEELRLRETIEALEKDYDDIEMRIQSLNGHEEEAKSKVLELNSFLSDQKDSLDECKLLRESSKVKTENLNQRITEKTEILDGFEVKGDEETKLSLENDCEIIKTKIVKIQDEIRKLLDQYEVASLEDLVSRKYSYDHFKENLDSLREEIQKESKTLQSSMEDYAFKEKELLKAASYYETVTEVDEIPEKMKSLREQIQKLHQLKTTLEVKLGELSEDEKNLSLNDIQRQIDAIAQKIESKSVDSSPSQNEEDYETVKKELSTIIDEIYSLGNDVTKMESTLKEKYREKKNVSQVENEISSLKNQLDELVIEYDALVLAGEVLGEAFTEIQRSFSPKLNDTTAKIFSKLTQGKYQKLRVNREFDIIVEDEKEQSLREWKFLSSGTMDQAYLALRLSVASLLKDEKDHLPLFLDDIFTQYDDARAYEALSFLCEYQKEGQENQQIILFTCHTRIINWAREDFKGISLQEI